MTTPLSTWEQAMASSDVVPAGPGVMFLAGQVFYIPNGVTATKDLPPRISGPIARMTWQRAMITQQVAADAADAASTAAGAAAAAGKTATAAQKTADANVRLPAAGNTGQVVVTNKTSETQLAALPAVTVAAGTAFEFTIAGTIQTGLVNLNSGTLTLRVYVGANAAAQTLVMPAQAVAVSASTFTVSGLINVRANGVYVASMSGLVDFPTALLLRPTVASTSQTTPVEVGTPAVVKVTAQWQNASTANRLAVEAAKLVQIAA